MSMVRLPFAALIGYLVCLVANPVAITVERLPGQNAGILIAVLGIQFVVELMMFRSFLRGERPGAWIVAVQVLGTAVRVIDADWTAAGVPVFLASAVLFVLRPPWSIGAFLVVILLSLPFSPPGRWWLGPAVAFFVGISLYVFGCALRLALRLRESRAGLAERAAAERERILRDVERTLGAGLSRIAELGDYAAARIPSDVPAAARAIRDAAGVAREVSAGVRRVAGGPQQATSLRDEIAATANLLTAAGMTCRVSAPDVDVPRVAGERLGADLRAWVGGVLCGDRAACAVELARHAGFVRLTLAHGNNVIDLEMPGETP